jgi:hypothetical protein
MDLQGDEWIFSERHPRAKSLTAGAVRDNRIRRLSTDVCQAKKEMWRRRRKMLSDLDKPLSKIYMDSVIGKGLPSLWAVFHNTNERGVDDEQTNLDRGCCRGDTFRLHD